MIAGMIRPFLFALALTCATAIAAQGAPRGTFRHAHNVGFGAQSSLDPASKGRVLQIIEKIQSRLVRPALDGTPSPDLATAWEPNRDGTVWTFHIREGVLFHDGTALDAADVVYSLKRVIDPDYGSPARAAVKMIETVEATGPLTVRMALTSSFADFPLQLMDPRLRIIPEGSAGPASVPAPSWSKHSTPTASPCSAPIATTGKGPPPSPGSR
jgi:peptide/nickel transport system substrate-binding protein